MKAFDYVAIPTHKYKEGRIELNATFVDAAED